ncbi:hypothetical protein SNEBB_010582 [Seison nebaliae]|nr:hypothetical protein SNEBB_010582 [Seison nebaliae]
MFKHFFNSYFLLLQLICLISESVGDGEYLTSPLINVAYQNQITSDSTCGDDERQIYCVQTEMQAPRKCHYCDSNDPKLMHKPEQMTDLNRNFDQFYGGRFPSDSTWWQSQSMEYPIQFPRHVTLNLKLGKSFHIFYIRLTFRTPRPESMIILRRRCANCSMEPWRFFSASCEQMYSMEDSSKLNYATHHRNFDRPRCTSEFSGITPLNDGTVLFAVTKDSNDNEDVDANPAMKEWMRATEIEIRLDRLNTFGDEIFGDTNVLRSYYYAIYDLNVGGRCDCNGHAEQCTRSDGDANTLATYKCVCLHNTDGPDCGQCLPFYQDIAWKQATPDQPFECKPCNCHGKSNECQFDEYLFNTTGSGGRCLNCRDNTAGAHCESCVAGYHRVNNQCVPCNCNQVGSLNQHCDYNGRCQCKPGVGGDKCDRCLPGYWSFTQNGCGECTCSNEGSINNICDQRTGVCTCKRNVKGDMCNECKLGYFDLQDSHLDGCLPCFCYGHSQSCQSSRDHEAVQISANFKDTNDNFRPSKLEAPVQTGSNRISIFPIDGDEKSGFLLPPKYLGDLTTSYDQQLTVILMIESQVAEPSHSDIVIEGGNGQKVFTYINSNGNPLPSQTPNEFKYRLNEQHWQPRLDHRQFMYLLSNVTKIFISAQLSSEPTVLLDVQLKKAVPIGYDLEEYEERVGETATWVEVCECPLGFSGEHCSQCIDGYRRALPNGGVSSRCVECDCHQHSLSCDKESGACTCMHHTAGLTCEKCEDGWYGTPLIGTEDDCQQCPCSNNSTCTLLTDNRVFCDKCPNGHQGQYCDECISGFFQSGDEIYSGHDQFEQRTWITETECSKCNCNGNIDPNAINNCDRVTGECLKCIHHTVGWECQDCDIGYWGNATSADTNNKCFPCNCHHLGTKNDSIIYPVHQNGLIDCEITTGQCLCRPNVLGLQCDQCLDGYYNLHSPDVDGCQACDCDVTGSLNGTCDMYTGQCHCRERVTGRRCDQCQSYTYGFSLDGCTECDCDPIGALNKTCSNGGQCFCRDRVVGRRCDECEVNTYDMNRGCIQCDECYNLVKKSVTTSNRLIDESLTTYEDLAKKPQDADQMEKFEEKANEAEEELDDVLERIDNLEDESKSEESFKNLKHLIKSIDSKLTESDKLLGSEIDETNKYLFDDVSILTDKVSGLEKQQKLITDEINKINRIVDESKSLEDDLSPQIRRLKNALIDIDKEYQLVEEQEKDINQQMDHLTNFQQNLIFECDKLNKHKEELQRQTEIFADQHSVEKVTRLTNSVKMVLKKAEENLEKFDNLSSNVQMIKSSLDATKRGNEIFKEIKIFEEKVKTVLSNSSRLDEAIEKEEQLGEKIGESEADAKNLQMKIEKEKEKIDNYEDQNKLLMERMRNSQNKLQKYKTKLEKSIEILDDFETRYPEQKKRAEDVQAIVTKKENEEKYSVIMKNADNLHESIKNLDSRRTDDLEKVSESLKRINTTVDDVAKTSDLVNDKLQKLNKSIGTSKYLLDGTNTSIVEIEDKLSEMNGESIKSDQIITSSSAIRDSASKLEEKSSELDNELKAIEEELQQLNHKIKNLAQSPQITSDLAKDLEEMKQKIKNIDSKCKRAGLNKTFETMLTWKPKSRETMDEEYKKLEDKVLKIERIADHMPNECLLKKILENEQR